MFAKMFWIVSFKTMRPFSASQAWPTVPSLKISKSTASQILVSFPESSLIRVNWITLFKLVIFVIVNSVTLLAKRSSNCKRTRYSREVTIEPLERCSAIENGITFPLATSSVIKPVLACKV